MRNLHAVIAAATCLWIGGVARAQPPIWPSPHLIVSPASPAGHSWATPPAGWMTGNHFPAPAPSGSDAAWSPPRHAPLWMTVGQSHSGFGVENDPRATGPGRLGLGNHWIADRSRTRATIPDAIVAPRWKTPYSYGYFGPDGKRQWTKQSGYRDRSIQWTLR